jgi:hypothetical protein
MPAAHWLQSAGLLYSSVRRYVGSEALPETLVEQAGERRIRIRADAIDHFRLHWRARRPLQG